ncbi:MAG: alpha-ribazole phosphatase [Thermoproteota archaeon]|nr:alpha-ribazole phosphatase [Thermoproteota archaeon]
MKEVFFMRHGLTKENELALLIGSNIDASLSEKGREELKIIKEYIIKPDIILCSDLKRAFETAEILFPNQNVIYLPQLREKCWGVLEGQPIEDARKSGLMRIEDENILKQNGIETPSSILVRANQVIQQINQISSQKIVVVSHGGFINYLMRILLPENIKREVLSNAHYHKIVFDQNERVIGARMNQSWLENC